MSQPAPSPLQDLSSAIGEHVSRVAQHIVAVHSKCSRSSGFAWRPNLIVTAEETLADKGEISVTLSGGSLAAAKLVGRDPSTDIALLRVDRTDLPAVALHDLPQKVGALAIAAGSRNGASTAAFGVVSFSGEKWRSLRGGEIDARIELDIALRIPGEGSLALDDSGRAFGMVVSGPRRRVLVIPAATIERVAEALQAHGRVPRGYLGLGLHPVKLDGDRGTGLMVMNVAPKGPGAAAGLQQGDVITRWNGQPIEGMQPLLRALGPDSVGSSIKLGLQRGGTAVEIDLGIGERPET